MIAAESIFDAIKKGDTVTNGLLSSSLSAFIICIANEWNILDEEVLFINLGVYPSDYEARIKNSWIWKELTAVRNIRPSFHSRLGMYGGLLYTAVFYVMGRGKEPWTLSHGGQSIFCANNVSFTSSYRMN